jgi:alpha-tubulin suppressor-like RCC1 family protein
MMGRLACGLVVLAACYAPTAAPGQACTPSHDCPDGLVCDPLSDTCETSIPEAARFASISAGDSHTCAIDRDGALWCWGSNAQGELGVGSTIESDVPVRVGGDSDWATIAAGRGATCGLRTDGTMWCWGSMATTGLPQSVTVPTQHPGTWIAIDVGLTMTCVVAANGDVHCHDAMTTGFGLTIGTRAVVVAASDRHQCYIDMDQRAFCWGANEAGQLGTGDTAVRDLPALVTRIPRAKAIVAGPQHTCAIGTDDTLWCWGACDVGEVGPNGNSTDGVRCPTPSQPAPEQHFRSVSVDGLYTCAVRDDSVMLCFGLGDLGQLGTLGGDISHVPVSPHALPDGWAAVSAGSRHTCGIREDGSTLCWGQNRTGQLGDGGGGLVLEPTLVDSGPWRTVTASAAITCGIREDGTLWCWGRNSYGELADGTITARRRPLQIGSDVDWQLVSAGWDHICAIKTDASLWCWGRGLEGQLGMGSFLDLAAPQRNDALPNGWTDVAAATKATCGTNAGAMYCWGGIFTGNVPRKMGSDTNWSSVDTQSYSRLFNNTICGLDGAQSGCWGDVATFPGTNLGDLQQLANGNDYACGIASGLLFCAGSADSFGQQGLGMPNAGMATMQQEATRQTWTRVDAGDGATCGITEGGALHCWGRGDMLGIGGLGDSPTALRIGSDTWRDVSVGAHHVCAITSAGALYCWGDSATGERGDGWGGSDQPVRVAPPT